MLKQLKESSSEENMPSYQMHLKLVNLWVRCRFPMLIMAVILLPLFPLFQTNNSFYFAFNSGLSEWNNHSWLIGYFGEYFLRHFNFPNMLNTHQFLNIPLPLFYAALFYRLIGLLSAITGAQIAIKVSVLLICFIQFVSVFNLMWKIIKDKWLSFTVATLCLWSIYSLTNLYNRADLTEFFAVSLLTTALCLWLYSFEVEGLLAKAKLRFLFVLSISLSFCFHPITALFGSLFMAFIIIGTLQKLIKERPLVLTIFICVCLFFYVFLALSPWIYIVWKFAGSLPLTPSPNVTSVWYIPGIDNFLVRLSPFPLDMRSITGGTNVDFGTPYLDAQINLPLLIISIFITFQILKAFLRSKIHFIDNTYTLFVLSYGLFIFFFLASLYPAVFSVLPRLFLNSQFAYRLVSYQNLALLVMTVSGSAILFKSGLYLNIKKSLSIVALISMMISCQGLLLKEIHAWSVMQKENRPEFSFSRTSRDTLLDIPPHFYGLPYYEITAEMNKKSLPSTVLPFKVGEGKHFGVNMKNVKISLSKLSYVSLSLYPFPWNHIYIDDKLVDSSRLFWDGSKMITHLKPGNHTVEVKFEPTTVWWLCQNTSCTLIMLGLIGSLIYFLIPYRLLTTILSVKNTSKLSAEKSV